MNSWKKLLTADKRVISSTMSVVGHESSNSLLV